MERRRKMLTIDQIISRYDELRTTLEDRLGRRLAKYMRLGRRLAKYMTAEQINQIGLTFEDEEEAKNHKPIPLTEDAVLEELKRDTLFGWEKAVNHRGLSSSMMFEVVNGWCVILENGLDVEPTDENYAPYGTPLFLAVAKHYGWEIDETEYEDEE